MKKRIISGLLAFVITIVSLSSINLSTTFAATSGTCGTSATWSYNQTTKTLTISGTGETADYGVSSLKRAPWYSFKDTITTIVVNEGITSLGQLFFYNCTACTSVSLPRSLRIIEGGTLNYGAFRECTSLRSITLPEGLTTIQAMAFRGCSALTSIRFPNTLTTLGMSAFRDCTNLETVTYGSGLKSTGEEAFYASGVRYVNFSSAITEISQYSFFNTKIVSIEIPEHITKIGTRAFANCTFLTSVTVYNKSCVFDGVAANDPFNGSSQTLTFYGHYMSTTQTFADEKGYNFVSIDGCTHENNTTITVKEPTCEEEGLRQVVCSDCDFIISETTLPANGHKWTVLGTEDLSDVDGHKYTFYTCTIEGCTGEQIKLEHVKNVEGYYTYANTATCDRPGLESYTCTVEGCGNVERHIAQSGNHQVENYVVTEAPTCTDAGLQKGTCSLCKAEVLTEIPALGHTNVLLETLDNTEDDGHIYEINKCTVCNEETFTANHIEWIDGFYTSNVISPAHCVVNGLGTDTCNVEGCGQTRIVQLPANGEHMWHETTRTEPTCTAVGKIYYACDNCTLTKSENIDALGHDYVLNEDSTYAPTCTLAGYNTYKCDRCGMTKKDIVNALGHEADEELREVIKEPTCTESGTMFAICVNCNEELTFELEPLGHELENQVEPIADKPGHSMVTPCCIRCDYNEPADVSHDEWIDGYFTSRTLINGSCIAPEVVRRTCDLCGTTKTDTVPAEGHKSTISATTNNGQLEYTCSVCGNVESHSPRTVMVMFRQYINTNAVDTTLGYMCDANGDGIVTAKDYSLIVKARQLEMAYE